MILSFFQKILIKTICIPQVKNYESNNSSVDGFHHEKLLGNALAGKKLR